MKIRKQPTKVTITLDPNDYWLVENKNDPNFYGDYKLTHRINMSYAGKADQEGPDFMYLQENEAQVFKEAGFDELISEGSTEYELEDELGDGFI